MHFTSYITFYFSFSFSSPFSYKKVHFKVHFLLTFLWSEYPSILFNKCAPKSMFLMLYLERNSSSLSCLQYFFFAVKLMCQGCLILLLKLETSCRKWAMNSIVWLWFAIHCSYHFIGNFYIPLLFLRKKRKKRKNRIKEIVFVTNFCTYFSQCIVDSEYLNVSKCEVVWIRRKSFNLHSLKFSRVCTIDASKIKSATR